MKKMKAWLKISFAHVWGRFFWYLFGNTILSLLFGLLFFWWFGHEIHFRGRNLEKEYFDAVCGVFAIIGLAIAIFQLAALRREEEVVVDTTRRIHLLRFTSESSDPVGRAIVLITDLKNLIMNEDLGPVSVKSFQVKVTESLSILQRIDSQQDAIGCDPIIASKNCVTLLQELQEMFLTVMAKKDYVANKQQWIVTVDKLLKVLEECFATLKR